MKKYLPELITLLLLAAGITLQASAYAPLQAPVFRCLYFAVAFLPVGLPVLREAAESLRRGDVCNEFTLMTLAAAGAFYIGEYPEGVAVLLFYSIGEKLQEGAVGRARTHIQALLDVRPATARLLSDGHVREVAPEQVQPGSLIEVRPGERVPLDGTLLTEEATFDTAALTGESMPRSIRTGGEVLAGMIAADKRVRLQVVRPATESALSRILALVEEAAARKAPAERFIRRFARIYTPVVTVLAALVVVLPWVYGQVTADFAYDFDTWLYRGLVFLVISCPCALVVSIPLSYYAGIGAASRCGILFKGGNYLDAIARVDTVVFDKTGTLTQGRFEVVDIQAEGADTASLLQAVASVEAGSNHPIARAITEEAVRQGMPLLPLASLDERSGRGLRALTTDGRTVWVGNARLMQEAGIAHPPVTEEADTTPVLCAIDGQYAGCLLLADAVKPDSREAVKALQALKIDKIQILSGDKQVIVSKLAERLGIDEAYGDLLPEGKAAHLKALKEARRSTAFAGDGLNDTPVLALSDVGIAMGGLGSDAAIETADVVIHTDQPHRVATAIALGRRTRRIVWQNIVLALGVKVAVMALGAWGWADLWAAVFADVGVALLAIGNALHIGTGSKNL